MSEPSPQPILVYDRIGQNRRRSIFLLALFAIILLPFVAQATMFLIHVLKFRLLFSDDELKSLAPAFLAVMSFFPVIILSAVLLGYYSASALVRRMLHARLVQQEEEPVLYRTVENLCIGAGLPQPRLYVLESNAPNACAIGLNPAQAVLVVTRGLMDLLDRRELEGVVAHELSHIGNHDIRLNTLVAALVTTLRLPLLMVKKMWPPAPAARNRQNTPQEYGYAFKAWVLVFSFLLWPAAGMDLIFFLGTVLSPVLGHSGVVAGVVTVVLFFFFGPLSILFVPFPIYVFIGAPGLGRLIGAAVLRRREFLADADAVLVTRNPAALKRALAKIAAATTGTFDVNPALYHLCVVSPVKRAISWWQMGVTTHPPIEERIARLEELDAGFAVRPAEKPWAGLAKIALFVLTFVAANVLAALALYFWLLTGARK